MKKNRKMLGLAAAALLAVAPVATSVVPVQAAGAFTTGTTVANSSASATTTTTKPTDRAYYTYNNEVIGEASTSNPSNNVLRTTINITAGKTTVADVTKAINDLGLMYFSQNSSNGQKVTVNDDEVTKVLKASGVTFAKDDKGKETTTIESASTSAFNFTISNGNTVVQIPMVVSTSGTAIPDATVPVFNWTENGTTNKGGLNGKVFQVAVGSAFNPLSFTNSNGEQITISAQQSDSNTTFASVEVTSNPVNTSEAGRYYNVTLTATGMTGKKTTATYTVLITSSHKQTLYANGQNAITTYSFYGNNIFTNNTTFKDGEQVYVSDQTKTYNKESYSQVSPKSKSDANSSNIWVKTSALVKPAGDTNVKTYPVMVDSRAYDKNGNYLGHMYYAYDNIDIVPTVVTINGKTYYKVANKDEYVRVTNITGNQRTLKHNAYIYWSSYRRTPGTSKMYRGQTVTTYGPQMKFKNGKKYYRIEGCRNNNKRYIKAVNFY